MRKIIPILIIAAAIIAALAYFLYFKPQKAHQPIKLWGNVEIREAEAAFRQAGRIREILVDEGDKVEEGQLLAELETDTFEDAIATSNAEIAMAGSEFSKLKNGSRPEEIALAEANVRQTEALLKNATEEFLRQSSLLPSGAVSQKIVDAARTQRDVAKANYDAAVENFKIRKSGFRKEDVASGQNRLEAAKAARQKLITALDDTKLYAPVAGIISVKAKEKGAIIAPNMAIFTISMQNPIYIRAYVPENQLGKFAPSTKVVVKTDSSQKEYEGNIGYISPRAEFTPKTVETENLRSDLVYRVRIIVKEHDGKLLQGMPVTIRLQDAQK